MPGSLSITNVINTQPTGNLSASLLDANWNVIRDYVNNREIASGTLAARPAASIAGRWYFATDDNGGTLYFDTGAAWTTVARPGLADRANFNYTFNGDFEIWGAGTTSIPTGWTLTGAGATVAKNTTAGQFKYTAASFALTRVGNDCSGYQDVDLISGFGPVGVWQSRVVTFGCWVRATVANRARLSINDGVATTNSSYHSGGSTMEFLTVTRTLDAAATRVRISCLVDTGDTTAQFDGAVLMIGNTLLDFIPSGWRGRKAIVQVGSGASTVPAGSTVYLHPGASNSGEVGWDAPFNKWVARRMICRTGGAAGVGETFIYTFRTAGVDRSVTATLANASYGTDLTNEFADAVGSGRFVSVKLVTSAAAAAVVHQVAIEFEEIP